MPQVVQRHVPMVSVAQNFVEASQAQIVDKVVAVPHMVQRQVPMI